MSATLSTAARQLQSTTACLEEPPVVIQYREAGATNSPWSTFSHEGSMNNMQFLCFPFQLAPTEREFLLLLNLSICTDGSFGQSSTVPADVTIWDRFIETCDLSLYLYASRKWASLADTVEAGERMLREEGMPEKLAAAGTTYSVKVRPRSFAEMPKPVYEAFYFDGRQYEGDVVRLDLRLRHPPTIVVPDVESIVPSGPQDRVGLENLFALSKSLAMRIFLRRSNVRMLRLLLDLSLNVKWGWEVPRPGFEMAERYESLWTVKTRDGGYEWCKFHAVEYKTYEIRTRVDRPGHDAGTGEGDEARGVRGQERRGCEREQLCGQPPQVIKSNSTFTIDTEAGVLGLMFGTDDGRTTVDDCPQSPTAPEANETAAPGAPDQSSRNLQRGGVSGPQ